VLPVNEICANGVDDNCNGQVDESVDLDGDGWGTCDGDCCDRPGACSSTPELVNPGAFEVPGNGVDDDCDPTTLDTAPTPECGPQALQAPTSAMNLANALDICNTTTESPPLAQKKWGIIDAQLLAADGISAPPQDVQVGVLGGYGSHVAPQLGSTMAALSSGTARDESASDWQDPHSSSPMGGTGKPPAVYLNAHNGKLQTTANCPAGSQIFDSADLRLTIRVPTNAKSFSYQFKFYSAEYPTFVCTKYNDFYLALLSTQAAGIPADHNISFDANNDPVSINNAFFQVCDGCSAGTNELVGTGMGLSDGGGTLWLTTTAPVVPGEELTIDFVIWDTSDAAYDSLVLLDNFRWDLNPAKVGTNE
jgi:hypothetical protein